LKCSNIEMIIKDEEQFQLSKTILKEGYKYLLAGYVFYSALGNKQIFSITSNNMYKFVCDTKILDDKFTEVSVDLCFRATNSKEMQDIGKKTIKNIDPLNGLIRYEFLECVVRMAKEKFVMTERA